MKVVFAAAAALLLGAPAIAQEQHMERDSRGIPVMNAEPNVPSGVNETPAVPAGATVQYAPATMFQTRPATATYPPCARGQTDRCTQTYERGRGPR